MPALHTLFAHLCGQVNLSILDGQALPFCQRCTGLYVGGAWAAICWLLFRPHPTARLLWTHGLFLLLMLPFGYHWLPQGPMVRTLTGWVFAFGLVYFLALNPWTYVASVFPRSSVIPSERGVFAARVEGPLPPRHRERDSSRPQRGTLIFHPTSAYFSALSFGALALLLALRFGGHATALALALLGAAGLVVYAALALATILVLARASRSRLAMRHG